MTTSVLAIDDLTIRDGGGTLLVDRVSLALPTEGALTLVGETGSGKSLVAQALFGLLPPHFAVAGRLTPNGGGAIDLADRVALRKLWRRSTMLLPQEPGEALDPTMRLGRQLAEIVAGDDGRVVDALGRVDLSPEAARHYPFALSGGMAQRALIAASLLTQAPVLVADEPTKGLDRARVEDVLALLRAIVRQGRRLMTITHDLAVATGLPGRLAVMKDGRIVEQGPTDAVLSSPRDPYTRAWLLAAQPSRWRRAAQPCPADIPVLSAAGLAFGWPGHDPLFADVALALSRGTMLALEGPSGCGKTTLANVLLGLRPPTGGGVSWAGDDPYRDRRARQAKRRQYQKLHQDPATGFIPHRPIGRQLRDLARVVAGLDLDRLVPPLLDRLKLKPALLARYPGEVSGGEAQRLALLRLLLLDPAVIVADEPTSRLDPIVQREVILLLRDCVDRDGLAVLLISHDRALIDAVADDTITLGAG